MINEISIIGDIIKAASSAGEGAEKIAEATEAIKFLKDMSIPNSLSKKAKSGIYEFPFLISSNIQDPSRVASMMKGMELEYSDMLLVSMGLNPSSNNAVNVQLKKVLSQYHTNDNDFSLEDANCYNCANIESKAMDVAFEDDVWKARLATPQEKNAGKSIAQSNPVVSLNPAKINDKYANMFNMTVIELKVRLGETESSEFKFPIGIKGIPHPLPFEDLCYVLSSFIKPQSDNALIRFIKWRTGEIRGLHNLLFRYDEIKRDVEFDKRVGANNSWLKVLRAKGNNRKMNIVAKAIAKLRGKDKINPTDILPNCTFVLTLSDVDIIEAQTGINIFQNPKAASKMLDDAMGLGLCIFDETHDVCHIMYSGYDKFSSYPISAVAKKDSGKDSNQILINMMKKML